MSVVSRLPVSSLVVSPHNEYRTSTRHVVVVLSMLHSAVRRRENAQLVEGVPGDITHAGQAT